MSSLLPFGQPVIVRHKFLEGEAVWVTSAKPSFFVGHDWQYEVRKDSALQCSVPGIDRWLWGPAWFDEMDLRPYDGESLPPMLNIKEPTEWPPRMTRVIGRRPGIYASNGMNDSTRLMYDMLPGSVACIGDYLGDNEVFWYKEQHPEVPIIVRFYIGPTNFQEDIEYHARTIAARVISKEEVKRLDPYIYFCNEMNLHYENGDDNPNNQHLYTTKKFYQNYANWVRLTADIIKQAVPEMKLITPPFAFGHKEDGEPDDDGNPKLGWAGYDYLADTVAEYFDNILTFHGYWGDGRGRIADRLYDPDLSSWYAFRWRRVLKLFETRYNLNAKLIIDEAGSFNAGHPEFFNDVRFYSQECLKDPRVLALTYFLWNDPTNSPGNVPNSFVQNIADLPSFVGRLKALPDIEVEADGPPPLPEPLEPDPDPEPPGPTPEPEPEPPPIGIQIDYVADTNSYVRGDLGEAGIPITLHYWGNEDTVISGTKDFGPGGFELMTHGPSNDAYKVEIEGVKYPIEVRSGYTTYITMGDGPPAEEQVRLDRSKPMSRQKAEEIIGRYPGLFEIEGES